MTKLLHFFLTLTIFSFIFYGCTSKSNEAYLPGYSGQVGELIVVCPKSLYESSLQKPIANTLEAPQYGLPQDEPLYKVIQVNPNSFNQVLNTHRNIFKVTVDDTVSKAGLIFKKNHYARGQMMVEVKALNSLEAIEIIEKNASGIVSLFDRAELNRLIARNKKQGQKEEEKKLLDRFGYSPVLQKDCEVRVNEQDFAWVRLMRERPVGGYQHQIDQNLIICETTYTNRTQFLDSILNALRDSIFSKIPGPSEGSYMTSDYEFVPPVFKEIELAGVFCKEARGLWKMENNFMGGPYTCYTLAHPKRDKLVHLIGFVYAPQFDKREYLRELEAVLKSISFN